jgi:hypothetical protein
MRSKIGDFYKKTHRWPGLIIAFILLYYGITGILMNHREFISSLDVKRNSLPAGFQYINWNNAALKGNLILSDDSILVYGNIGIWLTDSSFREYSSFNKGFPKGADNRKIFDVHHAEDGSLYAATLFGLFAYDYDKGSWEKFDLNADIKKFVAIESVGDTIYALNRSYLYKGKSEGVKSHFQKIELPQPENYDDRKTLFETIWQIHSGEIFGIPGKLFVDLLGLLTIFLSITGIAYFFFPDWIKRRIRNKKKAKTIIRINRWSLKWHNHMGAWTFPLLIIMFFAGIFLRPPLLIAIANARVKPIKHTHLDQANPWYDKLRDILYDKEREIFLFSTSEGVFFTNEQMMVMIPFEGQPPVSVMGINTFEAFADGSYLIGSFSGLFLWDPTHPEIYNYAQGKIHKRSSGLERPVGDFAVTGTIRDYSGNLYMIDYARGVIPLYHSNQFPDMPENVLKESKMSVWSLSLEIHTGRFFHFLIGDFYILIVPLAGLMGIIVVLSGYLLWRKRYRKRRRFVQ